MDSAAFDEAASRALVAVAGQMQVVLTQSTPATALEYDLRTATRHALNVVLPAQAVPEASVQPQFFGSTVDIGVSSRSSALGPLWDVLIELKWWYDPSNQVDDALRDVVKMATYRMLGVSKTAYLIAAGAESTWRKKDGYGHYTRLWDTGQHDLVELIGARSPYAAAQFSQPKQYPGEVPRTIQTIAVRTVPIQLIDGAAWLLRCARVEPGADGVRHTFDP